MCVFYWRCYRINFVFSFKFNLCLLRFPFPFLLRSLCLPLNLHINLALISDIQFAPCARLSSLFIYCVPLIYSVCGNWDRSRLCALFLFIKSVLVGLKCIFLIESCSNCVLIYTPNSKLTSLYIFILTVYVFCCFFAVWHFLFFVARSLIYANWFRWLNDKFHRYVPYYYDSKLTTLVFV